ncbi:hypothetical protein PZA11_004096 [Diplocarpon coronariae]
MVTYTLLYTAKIVSWRYFQKAGRKRTCVSDAISIAEQLEKFVLHETALSGETSSFTEKEGTDAKIIEGSLGVFAIVSISAGAEVLIEAPLFRGSKEDWLVSEAVFLLLSPLNQQRFMALQTFCTCIGESCSRTSVMKAVISNAFAVTDGSYVYELASRFTHDCRPNI